MNPIKIGIRTETKAINGIFAIPVIPKANIVKNGPSFKDKILTAPTSDESPYSPAKAAYNPPFELVKAATIAKGVIPSIPFIPNALFIPQPIIAPKKNLIAVRTTPFTRGVPTCLILICAPLHNTNNAIKATALFLNKAVVNPPISRDAGANVFNTAPNNKGTTINPPGIFLIEAKIFIS